MAMKMLENDIRLMVSDTKFLYVLKCHQDRPSLGQAYNTQSLFRPWCFLKI